MADKCTYCEERKPTNHLVLNGGDLWIEFCDDCGSQEKLTNGETGESTTVKELYENIKEN